MGHEQPIAAADVEGPIRHKLTVEEFLILDEAGVFGEKRVELIDGEIFFMSPVHLPHGEVFVMLSYEVVGAVLRLNRGLKCYSPVSTLIDNFNLPEPDLIVAANPGGDRFMSREAVRLVIEVSSSSLRYDLSRKAELYARAGLPEYWVADVRGRRVIRMAEPRADEYSERAEFAFGEPVPSATIPGLVVDTASL
jgi:Uma2 family endonuclease